MFKKLAFLFVAGLVSFTNIARAESLPLATVQHCETESGKLFEMVQTRYGEIPFLQGKTVVQAFPTMNWLEGDFYMTFNPSTGTFSIIVVDPSSGLECLWLGGGARPAGVQGDPT
jgi:hypothetical protein